MIFCLLPQSRELPQRRDGRHESERADRLEGRDVEEGARVIPCAPPALPARLPSVTDQPDQSLLLFLVKKAGV